MSGPPGHRRHLAVTRMITPDDFGITAVLMSYLTSRFAPARTFDDYMNLPPVTSSTVPVIYDDRSDARNTATPATSEGSPARPIGTSASFCAQIRSGIAWSSPT